MFLLSHVRRLAEPGVYRLVLDSEGAVGALRTYWEGWPVRTVIVGMLSIQCAGIWRCWSLLRGEATPRRVVGAPKSLISDSSRNGDLL